MAVFVDLGDEDNESHQNGQPPLWNCPVDALKPVPVTAVSSGLSGNGNTGNQREEARGLAVGRALNRSFMTQALGCYP